METFATYNSLMEMIAGVSLLTLAIFVGSTNKCNCLGHRYLVGNYCFLAAYFLIGFSLFGLSYCSRNGLNETAALLFQQSATVQILLLFQTTTSVFPKREKDKTNPIVWLIAQVVVLNALSFTHYYIREPFLSLAYCVLTGAFVVYASFAAVKILLAGRKGSASAESMQSRHTLMALWIGVEITVLLFVAINVPAPAQPVIPLFLAITTVLYILYAIHYHNHTNVVALAKREAAVALPAPVETAAAAQEVVVQPEPAPQIVYETLTTDEKIKNKLEDWVDKKGFCRPGITINELSKNIGINRTYLSKYINECYSCNFNCWLNKLRIDEAEKIMRQQPEMPLSDIAEKVGYADISHFSKQFKNIKGEPPSLYEKKIRQKEDLPKDTQ